jgi:hypothetical protein
MFVCIATNFTADDSVGDKDEPSWFDDTADVVKDFKHCLLGWGETNRIQSSLHNMTANNMNSSTTIYIVIMIRRLDIIFVKHLITSHGLSIEGS